MTGKRVLIVGLGRFGGGVGVTRWMVQRGAVVTVTDLADAESLRDSLKAIDDLNVTLRLGGHDLADLDAIDLVVVNPAVNKRRSVFFQEIVRRGIEWTTEINLFCERCPATVIGITGSYGKSTTSVMLADALRAGVKNRGEDIQIHLGGNIGRSLLGDLPRICQADLVVLEISNAQLEDLPRIHWSPDVAVITNIHSHHLDRYDDFTEYIDAKLNILCNATATTRIILGNLHPRARARLSERFPDHADRILTVENPDSPIELRVAGAHNRANAACVLSVGRALNFDELTIRDALYSFAGLPHRLEHIACVDDVDYYNDSKSTSPEATIVALESIDQPLVAIVGGQHKESASFGECAIALAGRCRAVICFGEASSAFAGAIRHAISTDSNPRVSTGAAAPTPGENRASAHAHELNEANAPIRELRSGRAIHPYIHETRDLIEAVRLARKFARPGDAVLFSPGAPSFDAFANYAERGRKFLESVSCFTD